MLIKLIVILCGVMLAVLPIIIKINRYFKWIIVSIGIVFLIFSGIDLYNTSKIETANRSAIDSLASKITRIETKASNTLSSIDSSIRRFGLKISGDSVVHLPTFVNNVNSYVSSKDQKGGQTAGTIINR